MTPPRRVRQTIIVKPSKSAWAMLAGFVVVFCVGAGTLAVLLSRCTGGQ